MATNIFQPSVPLWPNYGLHYTTSATSTTLGWVVNNNYVSYPAEAALPVHEDDLAWLYRRVREITDLAPKVA